MIKRTLYFGNPAYLSTTNEQLVIKLPQVEKNDTLPDSFKRESATQIPIEDIGIVLLDHSQITISQALISKLLEQNVALLCCNEQHLPSGLMLPLVGHTQQTERFRIQINSSLPLKKQLWQQTVSAKINNQAALLKKTTKTEIGNMQAWAKQVKSDDSNNLEARAAVHYWGNILPDISDFRRDRDGDYPNNLLNYGYAILRAIVARALVSSGMLPSLGIHHRNKYNPFCLADDVMEPYRPFVDEQVLKIIAQFPKEENITKIIKQNLLEIPILDVMIDGHRSPLMAAVSTTTASLYRCFSGVEKIVSYPKLM